MPGVLRLTWNDNVERCCAKRCLQVRDTFQFLLEAGCDPSIKNEDDLVPYSVSASKTVKQVFVQFRSENPERWNWNRFVLRFCFKSSEQTFRQCSYSELRDISIVLDLQTSLFNCVSGTLLVIGGIRHFAIYLFRSDKLFDACVVFRLLSMNSSLK